jgi:hypothetical protein
MPILCITTVPREVSLDMVLSTSKAIAAGGPPAGGISHVVVEDGGQVKIFDVWESEEAMNRFSADRLLPAIRQSMAAIGMDPSSAPPPPEFQIFEAHDAMGAST